MRSLRSKKLLVLLGTIVATGVLATGALSDVWATVTHTDAEGGIRLRVFSTSASGFDSGWHIHPGLVVVQVREGALQITNSSCKTTTVEAGQTFVEVPFFPARAVAPGRAVWTTTLIVTLSQPPAQPVPSPCP